MKQKLKALASLCLALALTLCLALPAWAAGGDAAGRSITEQTTGSISLSWDENTADDNTVTATAYKVIDVNYHYAQGSDTYEAPEDPEFTWMQPVATWLSTNDTYKAYIEASDNSVTEGFSEIEAAAVEAFTDDLAAAIRKGSDGGIQLSSVGDYTSQTHTISNLAMGSYLILVEGGTRVYKPVFVTLAPTWDEDSKTWELNSVNQNVTVKSSSLGITKTVVDGIYTQVTNADQPNGKKYAQVAIGDTVTYILEADVPQYPASATATGYYISDNLPDGMTLNEGSIAVKGYTADKPEVGQNLTQKSSANDENGHYLLTVTGTTGTPNQTAYRPNDTNNPVTFNLNFDYSKLHDNGNPQKPYTKLIVTYTATANAEIDVVDNSSNTNVNQNIAYLDYNNNPYETPAATWETDDDTATVYTYGIKVQKQGETQEGDQVDNLPGAVFELTAADEDGSYNSDATPIKFVPATPNTVDGAYRKAVTDTGATAIDDLEVGNAQASNPGQLQLSGLDVGTYYLKEIKAPDGYNLLAQPVKITITDDGLGEGTIAVNGKPEYTDSEKNTEVEADDGYVPVTVINTQGFTLPTTGGMGTVLFTAGGVVLMGAGLVLLVVFLRRRAK